MVVSGMLSDTTEFYRADATHLVSRTISIENSLESVGHLRFVLSIASIAGWAGHAGRAAMTGIIMGAFLTPGLVRVIFAHPKGPAAY